jgi:hypothetical protein
MTYMVRNNDKVPHDYTVYGVIGETSPAQGFLKGVAPGETRIGIMEGPGIGTCRITRVNQQ